MLPSSATPQNNPLFPEVALNRKSPLPDVLKTVMSSGMLNAMEAKTGCID